MIVPVDFLRAVTAEFRPDVCTIQRYTETTSGDGTTQTWATLATGVSCRVSRVGIGASEGFGSDESIRAIGNRRIKLPPLTDVTPKDRIVVGAVTYEVTDAPAISNETERTVIAKEVV